MSAKKIPMVPVNRVIASNSNDVDLVKYFDTHFDSTLREYLIVVEVVL